MAIPANAPLAAFSPQSCFRQQPEDLLDFCSNSKRPFGQRRTAAHGTDVRGYFRLSFRGKTVSTCHEFAALNAASILACSIHRAEYRKDAAIAPAVERTLGKGEVACSNHAGSTILYINLYVTN